MKIVKLRIEQYLGIEELETEVGQLALIEGGTGAGKTSILDAIAGAIGGDKAAGRPRLMRDGADKAVVLITLDNGLTIRRTVTAAGSRVEVAHGDRKIEKPQAWLQQVFGPLDVFEPVTWLNKNEKAQAEDLLMLLPLEVSQERYAELSGGILLPDVEYDGHPLAVLGKIEKALYVWRTAVNAEAKGAAATATEVRSGIPEGFDAKAVRGVELREKFDELRDAQAHNAQMEGEQRRLAKCEALMADLAAQLDRAANEAEMVRDWLAENSPEDTAALEEAVATFEEQKRVLGQFDYATERAFIARAKGGEAEALTALIETVRGEPARLLSTAPSPVEGLSVDETGTVTIGGRPLGNLSGGERVRLALQVAKARQGSAGLMLVDGLEQLDADLRAEFLAQAEADEETQYLVTLVTSGPLSFASPVATSNDPFGEDE